MVCNKGQVSFTFSHIHVTMSCWIVRTLSCPLSEGLQAHNTPNVLPLATHHTRTQILLIYRSAEPVDIPCCISSSIYIHLYIHYSSSLFHSFSLSYSLFTFWLVFWRGRATLKRAIAHVSKPHHMSMDELHRRVGLDCHECLLRACTRFLDSVCGAGKRNSIYLN